MARKMTKTALREQSRLAYEARQREKRYAILKIENERGWGFVSDATPQLIAYLVPDFRYAEGESIHTVNSIPVLLTPSIWIVYSTGQSGLLKMAT